MIDKVKKHLPEPVGAAISLDRIIRNSAGEMSIRSPGLHLGWMLLRTQYLLGVRPTMKGLLIDPVLPSNWDKVTVDRIFRGCRLHIQIIRSADSPHLTVDGAEMPLTNGKAVIPADFCHSHSSAEILFRFVKQ